jgi:acyl-CoA synthetase (AMP-forming)/AMP-acid ligase II
VRVIEFFDRGWRQRPQATAFISRDGSWTYDEARTHSCRIANRLIAAGHGRDRKAAVLSPNDVLAWVCVLGIWRSGMAWVPLNPARPAADTRNLISNFDCEIVFFHDSLAAVVAELAPELPKVRDWVALGDLNTWPGDAAETEPGVEADPDDTVVVFPTGGTTGLPKGVMNTHRSLAITYAHLMLAFQYRVDEPIVNLAAAPMTHASGLLTLPTSARGGSVVVIDRADPRDVLDAIERHQVTELFLPPTVIYRMLEVPGVSERQLSSLRYLLYTSAPMSTEKLRRALEVFGPVMMEGYGQAEAWLGISFMRPEEHIVDGQIAPDSRLASCGRPYPLISLEIRDGEDRPVPTGESGEICVRGDLVMQGYYNAPEQTAKTIVNGWLHTGDIGYVDEGGYIFITDRKKDMIISGGFNVYPSEIEQVIWSHPAVQDCAVIGVPDEDWGEAVKAVVELNPGDSLEAEELIELCRARLGSIRAPKSVDFIDSLPRSPNGKVLKTEVRRPYWEKTGRHI